ncbi:helix-turn-helix domain-containing protein [Rhizobium sp. KVB221]|uniref:Helix-turn-helix domain-containing protein n=1 Tax=Rhizobium setariae TaxID=2801340 RepID=A0A936YR60_9HYPH|nr:helix-turn-helix domain-containing protein [Rhizobium setariae]MBL0373262.1 helix-turn-helix domain-containing protein [Rhizobium setariae]
METVISTAGMDPASRSTYWHQAIAEAYFSLNLQFGDSAHFNGELLSWNLGSVSLSRLRSGALQYKRLKKHLVQDCDEQLLITIPARSEVFFSQCGNEVRCSPGSYILERSHEPYEFSHSEDADLWVLKIATKALAGRIRAPDRFCSMQFNATNGVGGLFTDLIHHIPERFATMPAAAREAIGNQLVDLLALSIESDERTLTSGASTVRTAHLTRIENYVRANLHRLELDPELIAGECGISIRYLHELFRDTNQTLGQWIRDMRLEAAREDLLTTRNPLSISEICYRRGFSDQAYFSRVFKSKFDLSPRDYRQRNLGRLS